MPIYEYVCEDCATTYERLVRSSSDQVACPKCGSRRKQLQFSTFSSPNGSASTDSPSSGGSCACTPRSCGCH